MEQYMPLPEALDDSKIVHTLETSFKLGDKTAVKSTNKTRLIT